MATTLSVMGVFVFPAGFNQQMMPPPMSGQMGYPAGAGGKMGGPAGMASSQMPPHFSQYNSQYPQGGWWTKNIDVSLCGWCCFCVDPLKTLTVDLKTNDSKTLFITLTFMVSGIFLCDIK